MVKNNKAEIIGTSYKTNSYGDVLVIDYNSSTDVTIRFSRTGYTTKTRMDRLRRGAVMDHSVSIKNNKALYDVWVFMRQRCRDENCPAFKDYGARGIQVCAEWEEFWRFKVWADSTGYRKGLSIERSDNDKSYNPDNCVWATASQQASNRRSTSKYGSGIWKAASGGYIVQVTKDKVRKYLGTFADLELAKLVRDEFLEGV